jgi:hypothetical protein
MNRGFKFIVALKSQTLTIFQIYFFGFNSYAINPQTKANSAFGVLLLIMAVYSRQQ